MPGRRGPRGPQLPRPTSGGAEQAAASPTSITEASDFPELFVEWLPDDGPAVADGVWESMTAYVASGSCRRGRKYVTDRVEKGTLSLTLRTTTRLFDPDNTAGTYYGKLKVMRQIRVQARWRGTVYPVFRGFVTSWGTTVEQDRLFVTTIQAADAFERLERIKLPSSAWALEIVKDKPSAWFRLGESDTTRVTDSSSNGNYGIYDNCEQGQSGLVVNDADGAAAFAHSLEERVVIQNPNLITGYPFTVSTMLKVKGSDNSTAKMIFSGLPGTPTSVNDTGIEIYVGIPTPLIAALVRNGSDLRVHFSSVIVADNRPHHVLVEFTSASSFSVYVDGVLRTHSTVTTSGTGAPAWPGQPTNFVIGNITDIGGGDYGFGANDEAQSAASIAQGGGYVIDERGTLDEVCVWDGTTLASDRIAAQSLAALTGWEGDDTGTRVSRFLDAIDWPAELRDIDTGISILGPAGWTTGTSALNVLYGWADTELGQFFIGKDGKIVWRSRHYPLLDLMSRRSQATYVDAHSGTTVTGTSELLLEDGTAILLEDGTSLLTEQSGTTTTSGLGYDDGPNPFVRDSNLLRNPIIASRKNGVTVTVSDDANQLEYGDRSWNSPTTEDRDDAAVRDRAMWLLARFKDETSRLQAVTFTPRKDPINLWPEVLGRELGDRVTVKQTPAGLDSTISQDHIVESIAHDFAPRQWRTTFTGSPVDPNVGTYLVLDDATEGLLDTAQLAY